MSPLAPRMPPCAYNSKAAARNAAADTSTAAPAPAAAHAFAPAGSARRNLAMPVVVRVRCCQTPKQFLRYHHAWHAQTHAIGRESSGVILTSVQQEPSAAPTCEGGCMANAQYPEVQMRATQAGTALKYEGARFHMNPGDETATTHLVCTRVAVLMMESPDT